MSQISCLLILCVHIVWSEVLDIMRFIILLLSDRFHATSEQLPLALHQGRQLVGALTVWRFDSILHSHLKLVVWGPRERHGQ